MAVHQLAPKHPKADNVALRLNVHMGMKRAKRDLTGLPLCVGFVRWKT
jgi:hypothetical protein